MTSNLSQVLSYDLTIGLVNKPLEPYKLEVDPTKRHKQPGASIEVLQLLQDIAGESFKYMYFESFGMTCNDSVETLVKALCDKKVNITEPFTMSYVRNQAIDFGSPILESSDCLLNCFSLQNEFSSQSLWKVVSFDIMICTIFAFVIYSVVRQLFIMKKKQWIEQAYSPLFELCFFVVLCIYQNGIFGKVLILPLTLPFRSSSELAGSLTSGKHELLFADMNIYYYTKLLNSDRFEKVRQAIEARPEQVYFDADTERSLLSVLQDSRKVYFHLMEAMNYHYYYLIYEAAKRRKYCICDPLDMGDKALNSIGLSKDVSFKFREKLNAKILDFHRFGFVVYLSRKYRIGENHLLPMHKALVSDVTIKFSVALLAQAFILFITGMLVAAASLLVELMMQKIDNYT